MVLARKGPLGFSRVSNPGTPTQAGSLCYIALRSVERFVESFLRGIPRAHRYHATVLVLV